MTAIGIDLGTNSARVAVWQKRSKAIKIIPNEFGNKSTPAFVAFTNVERLIGDEAKNKVAMNSKNTVYNVKRFLGRTCDDVKSAVENLSFNVIGDDDDNVIIEVDFREEKKQFRPEELTAMVLYKMKMIAEKYLGEKITDAVISVPALFGTNQRQATLDAGKIAGLNVIRLINEPTAAALAFGFESQAQGQRTILVFHLGGGSCDASIIKIKDALTYEVIAVAGDDTLGGEDFDSLLMDHFRKEFCKKHNVDSINDKRALRRLRTACERTKILLSTNTEAAMEIDSFYEGTDFFSSITRVCFEEMCCDLLKKIGDCVEKALKAAKLKKTLISDVIMVGGSTHIPKIRDMINTMFSDKQMNFTMDAAEIIVQGTVVQAAMLTNSFVPLFQEMKVTDIASFSLKTKRNGKTNCFVEKYRTIPCEEVTTVNMKCLWGRIMTIEIHEDKEDNNGRTLVKNYFFEDKQKPIIGTSFKVKLSVSADGVFNLSVELKPESKQNDIYYFDQKPHLDEDNIAQMITAATSLASLDEHMQQSKLAKTKLLDCILYWEQAIAVAKEPQEFEGKHKGLIQQATNEELEGLDLKKCANAKTLQNRLVTFDENCEKILADALKTALPSWIFEVLAFERKSK